MSFALKEETRDLQTIYGALCRVQIGGAEGMQATINIRKHDKSLNIKFQVPATYPATTPIIGATSPSLGAPQKEELIKQLTASAESLRGTSMIALLVEEAYQWCAERNIHLGPEVCPP